MLIIVRLFGALFYKEYKMIIAVDFDGTIVENSFPNIGYLKEDKTVNV